MAKTALETALEDLFPPGTDLAASVESFLAGTDYLGFNAVAVFKSYRAKFSDSRVFARVTIAMLLLSTQTGAAPEKRLSRNVGDAQIAKKAITLWKAAGVSRRPDSALDVTLPRLEIIFLHQLIALRKILERQGKLRRSVASTSPLWCCTPAANGVIPESADFQLAFAEKLAAAKAGKPLDDTAKAAVKLRVSEFAELNRGGWRADTAEKGNVDDTKIEGIELWLTRLFEETVAQRPAEGGSGVGASASGLRKKGGRSEDEKVEKKTGGS